MEIAKHCFAHSQDKSYARGREGNELNSLKNVVEDGILSILLLLLLIIIIVYIIHAFLLFI